MDNLIDNKLDTIQRHSNNRVRIIAYGLTLIMLCTIAYGSLLLSDAFKIKDLLFLGRNHLKAAYSAIKSTNFEGARQHFKEAHVSFTDAGKLLDKPSFTVLMAVPKANKNILALRQLTAVGKQISSAGEALSHASMRFSPQEGDDKYPDFSYGRINLKAFIDVKRDIDDAASHIHAAVSEYRHIPQDGLISPIRKASAELSKQLPKLESITKDAQQIVSTAPDLLGANGERRYFLAVQNNAELRATGGIIGNYGIIVVDKGDIRLEEFDEIHKLRRRNQPAVEAPENFASRYKRFKATSEWLNVNMSPDLPTVGRVLAKLYKSVKGQDLDGVISIDPVGLKYLLAATGPIKLTDPDGRPCIISEQNVVDQTLVKAYKDYKYRPDRKSFLANVAEATWARIISVENLNKPSITKQLKRAFDEGHIMFFSSHEQEQKLMEDLGYAGELLPTSNDYLQVVMQNHAGNKLDVYMHQKIDYFIHLRKDGTALVNLKILISNRAPLTGLTSYVAGNGRVVPRGYSNTWLNVFVPKDAQLLTAKQNDGNCAVEVGREKDKAVFSDYVCLAPGTTTTLHLEYKLPDAVLTDNGELHYSIDWQAQPVINVPSITLHVEPPEGFKFKQVPMGFKKKGRVAAYDGVLERDKKFDFIFTHKQ